MSGPLNVPTNVTSTATATAVLQAAAVRTRLLYLSCTNNDAGPCFVAIYDATTLPAIPSPRQMLGPIAPGATYIASDADFGSNVQFDHGIVAELVTGQPGMPAGTPRNIPTVTSGVSGTWNAWVQIVP